MIDLWREAESGVLKGITFLGLTLFRYGSVLLWNARNELAWPRQSFWQPFGVHRALLTKIRSSVWPSLQRLKGIGIKTYWDGFQYRTDFFPLMPRIVLPVGYSPTGNVSLTELRSGVRSGTDGGQYCVLTCRCRVIGWHTSSQDEGSTYGLVQFRWDKIGQLVIAYLRNFAVSVLWGNYIKNDQVTCWLINTINFES